VAADFVGVAVFEGVACVVDSWHQNGVKSCHTSATGLAQVHIILDAASEEICSEVFGCIKLFGGREIHSVVVVKADLGSVSSST